MGVEFIYTYSRIILTLVTVFVHLEGKLRKRPVLSNDDQNALGADCTTAEVCRTIEAAMRRSADLRTGFPATKWLVYQQFWAVNPHIKPPDNNFRYYNLRIG